MTLINERYPCLLFVYNKTFSFNYIKYDILKTLTQSMSPPTS